MELKFHDAALALEWSGFYNVVDCKAFSEH